MKTLIITCLAAAALMMFNGCQTDNDPSSPHPARITQPTEPPPPTTFPLPVPPG
jgi:hypothetical protein